VPNLIDHLHAQRGARHVLDALGSSISAADSERSLAERAASLLREVGFPNTWYYDCPALVLLGSRSCTSISGRDYVPSDERVGDFNLVTVDLSPSSDGAWGDCARSYCVEGGRVSRTPAHPEFQAGMALEASLHAEMRAFVTSGTTFGELFDFAGAFIATRGFENLDRLGNVGHSIATRLEDRVFIEAGNTRCLGDVQLFTFEPHIRRIGGRWGFKHEEIYRFDESGRPTPI